MSRRRELEAHRRSLGEIREILDSMKTLAYMETRKLSRFLNAQRAVRENVEAAAHDFLCFYPQFFPKTHEVKHFYILVGSERGFCADFNHKLLNNIPAEADVQLLACGHKLTSELDDEPRLLDSLEGATVAEDVDRVLNQLVSRLVGLQAEYGSIVLHALYQDGLENDIITQQLLPPFQGQWSGVPRYSVEPELNLEPEALMLELTDHYLYAVLNEILYSSLMAENHQRVAHLEGAVEHLDEEGERLQRRSNALWQEEITEEIEVILLSSTQLENTNLN